MVDISVEEVHIEGSSAGEKQWSGPAGQVTHTYAYTPTHSYRLTITQEISGLLGY
jgi:hypothetical protein